MSIAMTSGQGGAPRRGLDTLDVARVAEGAVDLYDVAARLELRGVGDAVASARGYRDIFEWAADVAPRGTNRPDAPRRLPSSDGLRRAWSRSAVLTAGVLLCLPLMPRDGIVPLFAAASVGWLAAQVSSTALWWGIGRAQPAAGARLALRLGLTMLVAASALALLTGWWTTPLWAIWGASAAAANTVWASRRTALLLLVSAGAVAAPVVLLEADWRHWPAHLFVLGFGGCVYIRLDRMARTRSGPLSGSLPLLGWSVVTAVTLQGLLATLMMAQGDRFVLIATAGVVAGIASEPILEQVSRRVRATAAASSHWRRARLHMIAQGVFWTLAVGFLSLAVAGLVSWLILAQAPSPIVATSAFTVAALSGAVGLFMRTGSARGAARVALFATAVALCANSLLLDHPWSYAALGVATSVLVVTLAARRLSLPLAW